jgi:hypothetical protein
MLAFLARQTLEAERILGWSIHSATILGEMTNRVGPMVLLCRAMTLKEFLEPLAVWAN